MRREVSEVRRFYETPLGAVAARMIARKLSDAWGSTGSLDILGVGYAPPWLEAMGEARRSLAAMPGGQGAEAWPLPRSRTCLVEDDALPFPTGCFDRVLAVHALEEARDPVAMVREMSRVLAPSGRLILVAAARGGLWARSEHTPFGQGRPYTLGQLERLVEAAELEPFARTHALFVPPWARLAGAADLFESVGQILAPGLSGVVLLEAVRNTYALRPVGAAEPAYELSLGLTPQAAGMRAGASVRLDGAGEAD